MEREFGISTADNPYNPITNFNAWYSYDVAQGYNTCSYLARLVHTSEELSDELNDDEIENAIDEIVKNGFAINRNGEVIRYIKV